MPWQWYSIYNIDPNPNEVPKNMTDDQIDRSIMLLKMTANVHNDNNFPGNSAQEIEAHRNAVKQKVDSGFLVIAYQPSLNPQRRDDTLYFQYSKKLSGPHVIHENDNTVKQPPFSPVWVVSHGLEPDNNNFPGNADQGFCRGYIRGRLTQPMRRFMQVMNVDHLYSIDQIGPDANPTGRPIGKLQYHGNGDQWESSANSPVHYQGTQQFHGFWGGVDGEFHLTTINDRGT